MKRIFAFFLTAMLLLALCACGGETAKVYDLPAIRDEMIAQLAITEALPLPDSALYGLYSIDAADVKSSACFTTMDGAFPDEVLMVEAVDAAAAARIQAKLEARLKDVTNQAQNYDPESLALFQKCQVVREGNYVNLFISAQYTRMQEIFTASGK